MTTFVATSPEDVLAVVPVVLGFVPTDSVVMLTFGGSEPFHARVDLPEADAVPDLVHTLVAPAVRHGVRRVVIIVYAEDARPADGVARALAAGLQEAGIDVVECLRADGRRWFPLRAASAAERGGVPYDVRDHPFAAQAVLDGRVTHSSRAELAGGLAPDAPRVAAVATALRTARPATPDEVVETVRHHLRERSVPDDEEAAALLLGLLDDDARAAAWALQSRASAREHVALWTDLVRRAPDPVLVPAGSLLAFAAWLVGHGALAWCALDRVEALDPDDPLAAFLAQALEHALPPSVWSGPGRVEPRPGRRGVA
ncbi:MAG: DUF4192 domain-containing protein [Nocardioides sp.]